MTMVKRIEDMIYLIRGQRVMLDSDLAEIYGVELKRLNEQVRRNHGRFPQDFAFQLVPQEFINLKSQIATSSLQTLETQAETRNLAENAHDFSEPVRLDASILPRRFEPNPNPA